MGSGLGTLGSTAATFDANDRLNSDTYDANGNTLLGAGFGQSLPDEYDFENHLVTRHTSGSIVHITYDGDGNRVSKTLTTSTNSVTTYYVVDGTVDLVFAGLGATGVFLPPGGFSFALAGGGSATVGEGLAQALIGFSAARGLVNVADLIRILSQSLGNTGSSGATGSGGSSSGISDSLETARMRRQIVDVLRTKIAPYIAKIKQLDPSAQIGIRGSTVSGRSATSGALWDPNAFDLDVFVKSDTLGNDYFPAADLFKQLKDASPELFDGLYKVTIKVFSHASNLGSDAVFF